MDSQIVGKVLQVKAGGKNLKIPYVLPWPLEVIQGASCSSAKEKWWLYYASPAQPRVELQVLRGSSIPYRLGPGAQGETGRDRASQSAMQSIRRSGHCIINFQGPNKARWPSIHHAIPCSEGAQQLFLLCWSKTATRKWSGVILSMFISLQCFFLFYLSLALVRAVLPFYLRWNTDACHISQIIMA